MREGICPYDAILPSACSETMRGTGRLPCRSERWTPAGPLESWQYAEEAMSFGAEQSQSEIEKTGLMDLARAWARAATQSEAAVAANECPPRNQGCLRRSWRRVDAGCAARSSGLATIFGKKSEPVSPLLHPQTSVRLHLVIGLAGRLMIEGVIWMTTIQKIFCLYFGVSYMTSVASNTRHQAARSQ